METDVVGWTFWKSSLKRDQIAEGALCLPPVAFMLPAWNENMMVQTLMALYTAPQSNFKDGSQCLGWEDRGMSLSNEGQLYWLWNGYLWTSL